MRHSDPQLDKHIVMNFSNRPEIGFLVFRMPLKGGHGRLAYEECFTFEDTVAVAALILTGRNPSLAASFVFDGVVYVVPHAEGRGPALAMHADSIGRYVIGNVRLTDGSVWSVIADNDLHAFERGRYQISYQFHIIAKRGLDISEDDVMDRIKHLIEILPC